VPLSAGLRRYLAFFTVLSGFFMALLDSTIVNITLPKMTEFFRTDMNTISWVVNGYNIAFAVLLITASRLADQFGRKRVFMLGVALFTLTSYLSGIAATEQLLVFFRVLQGLSGALIVPVSLPLVLELFPANRSGTIIGAWGAVGGVSAASGPALGGIICEYFHWQWIFFINIPIGIVALALTALLVRESNDPTASKRIDWLGVLSLTVGSFALTLALVQANDKGWSSAYILGLFVTAAASIAAFIFIERTVKEPMLPLKLLRIPEFAAANATLFMLGVGLMCGVFFLAFFLTRVMDMSQLEAGLTITALPIATIVTSGISGPLSDRVGSRWFGMLGFAVLIVGVYMCSKLTPDSTRNEVIQHLIIMGAGLGFALPPVVGASVRSVPADKIGVSSGVGNMSRTLGAVLGVALLVTIVTHYAEKNIAEAKVRAEAMVAADTVLRSEFKEAIVDRLHQIRFSQDSQIPTQDQVVAIFQQREDAMIDTLPPMKKAIVKAVLAKQNDRVRELYPQLKTVFKQSVSVSFSKTFRLSAWVLILGIVVSFFCDPVGKRRKRAQSGAKASKAVMH